MKKFFKWLFIIIFILILGVVIFILTFDLNKYKPTIEKQLSDALNRPVIIGDMGIKISFVPTIAIYDIHISNPAGIQSPTPFLSLDSADLTVDLMPLLDKKIEIDSINFGTLTLNLIEQNGINNWSIAATKPADTVETADIAPATPKNNTDILSQLQIDNITMKKLLISYQKDASIQEIAFSDFDMRYLSTFKVNVDYKNYHAKLNVNMSNILQLAKMQGLAVANIIIDMYDSKTNLAFKIDNLADIDTFALSLDSKTPNLYTTLSQAGIKNETILKSPFTFNTFVSGSKNNIQITRLLFNLANAISGNFKGAVSDAIDNPHLKLAGDFSVSDNNMAAAVGIQPFVLDFDIDMKNNILSIVKANLSANKSDLAIKGDILTQNDIPDAALDVFSNYFDINDFIIAAPASATATPSTTPATPQNDTIDLSILKSFNLKSSVQFKNFILDSDNNAVMALASNIQVKDGLLLATPAVRIYDGIISGNIALNGKTSTPAITAKITANNIDLDKIKEIAAELKGSKLNFATSLTTTGNTNSALMKNLNGDVQVNITQGKILNKWINDLPETLGLSAKKSVFGTSTAEDLFLYCLAFNLDIVNGTIDLDDKTVVETSLLNLFALGSIDLTTETLAISLKPEIESAKASVQKSLLLSQMVNISGPFNDLSVSLDASTALSSAINTGMTAGIDVLKNTLLKQDITSSATSPTMAPGGYCTKILANTSLAEKSETATTTTPTPAKTTAPVEKTTSKKESIKNQLLNEFNSLLKNK